MKKYIPSILAAIFPYSVLFALYCMFSGFLMHSVFQSNGFLLLLAVLLFWVVSLGCAVATCVMSLARKWDSYELARANMILKLIPVPAYILIFLIGCAFLITIFTFAISIILMLLDGMAIVLSGLIGVAAVKRNHSDKILSTKEMVVHGILQFVFCADVVSAIVVFCKARRAKKQRGRIHQPVLSGQPSISEVQ